MTDHKLTIESLVTDAKSSISETMDVINKNGRGICLVINAEKELIGVATDGDIRRYLIKGGKTGDLIEKAMNKEFIALPFNSSDSDIRSTFRPGMRLIPLIDENSTVVDFADVNSNHKIPVLQPRLSGNESKYVNDCISSNWISSQGSYVKEFENTFKGIHNCKNALAVCNGTAALHLAIEALGIKEGDEVIVPNLTFAASVNSVIYSNATPVLCDVDPKTFCIDLEQAEKLITCRTRAIMLVHLYGNVCDIDGFMALAEAHRIHLIEDCAEAIGSRWKGNLVGTFGDAATFSFFGNKTISTGEGGMLLMKSSQAHNKAKILRDHGMDPTKRYWHELIGFNYRMTNLQAAVGQAQMEQFDEIINKKIQISLWYRQYLNNPLIVFQKLTNADFVIHSNWLFTVTLDQGINTKTLANLLLKYGIETRPVFYPMHQMPPYKKYQRSDSLCASETISCHGISLPSSTSLNEAEVKYICETLEYIISNYELETERNEVTSE